MRFAIVAASAFSFGIFIGCTTSLKNQNNVIENDVECAIVVDINGDKWEICQGRTQEKIITICVPKEGEIEGPWTEMIEILQLHQDAYEGVCDPEVEEHI